MQNSIFNLADDEILTHRGQTLSEIEKFDDPRSDEEEEEEEEGEERGKLGGEYCCNGSEVRISNKSDENSLAIWERKILRRLLGPVK